MALLCIIAVYNEERLLDGAIRSALAAGADRVHVFDGAWRALGGPGFDGATRASSTDATAAVARAAGAVFHQRRDLWPDQGTKRTSMFHRCKAARGDHLFVLDADERVAGTFPSELPAGHLNVLLRSVGPNDLPGARHHFPRGDYSVQLRPALRVFAWAPDLVCVSPGHYVTAHERIEPYDGVRSRLPVVGEVCVEHHANLRDLGRLAAKRAYYAVDHPARRVHVPAALAALGAGNPWITTTKSKGGRMAEKRIAKKRIYGIDSRGRTVLVAAPGQPIPDGFELAEPALDHKRSGPSRSTAKRARGKRQPTREER